MTLGGYNADMGHGYERKAFLTYTRWEIGIANGQMTSRLTAAKRCTIVITEEVSLEMV